MKEVRAQGRVQPRTRLDWSVADDLLSAAAVDNSYLVLRRAKMTRTAYALRTDDWKVAVSGEANMEFYDLRNDPGEQRNLAADQLLLSAGLENLWYRRLGNVPGRPQNDLDDDDRAMLKELGYLDGQEAR